MPDNLALPLSGSDVNASGRSPRPLVATDAAEENGEISPNGLWVAYESDASGQSQVYVRSFDGADRGFRQVSSGGGRWPLWSGDSLFYVAGNAVMALSVGSPALVTSVPEVVLDITGIAQSENRNFDVHPDGRFLFVRPIDDGPDLVVVEHWLDELKRLLPVD